MTDSMELFSRRDAAALLCVSVRSLDRLRQAGRIRGVMIGGRRVYLRAELERLVSSLPADDYERNGGNHEGS